MRIIPLLTLLFLLQECKPKNDTSIAIGSWCNCLRDGGYREFRIDANQVLMTTTEFEEGIAMFNNDIEGNSIIISGDNVINGADTLTIMPKTKNLILLKNSRNEIELTKLEIEISKIDSSNLTESKKMNLELFQRRHQQAKCPDLRSEEEKNRVVPMGSVDDDFDDLVEIPYNIELDKIVEQ